MIILVTNDDGVNSKGLKVLLDALRNLRSGVGARGSVPNVYVVAPDRQRSAVGLSITLDRPLRIERLDERTFSVDGMPADCVELAIHRLMESQPDLIISGINHGQNLGYDIYHSGTVGAAVVGTMFGIPSIAVSIADSNFDGSHHEVIWYDTAAQVALKLAKIVLERGLPRGTLLNINVPNVPASEIRGIEVTRHCRATYDVEIHHRLDPRGKEYYWLGGAFQKYGDHSETDIDVLRRRKVSVTPLRLDLTDYSVMQELSDWIVDTD